jgi:hypothetical protein
MGERLCVLGIQSALEALALGERMRLGLVAKARALCLVRRAKMNVCIVANSLIGRSSLVDLLSDHIC